MTERDNNYSGWSRVRFFVPVKLKSVLAKYGELKSFRLLKEDEEKCNQVRFALSISLHVDGTRIPIPQSFDCCSSRFPLICNFRFMSVSCRFASDYFVHSPAVHGRILRHPRGGLGMGKSERTSG